MSDDPVATLRRFNRSWSQRVGVLDESFLGSGRPLGPSRLLFELRGGGTTCGSSGSAGPRLRLPEPPAATARGRRAHRGHPRSRRRTAPHRDADQARRRRAAGPRRPVRLPRPRPGRRIVRPAARTPRGEPRPGRPPDPRRDRLPRPRRSRLPSTPGLRSPRTSASWTRRSRVASTSRPALPTSRPWAVRPAGSSWRSAAASPSGAVASSRCPTTSARSSGCGCTVSGAASAWPAGSCAGSRRSPSPWVTGSSGSTPTARSTEALAMYRAAGYVEIPRYNDNPYPDHWFEKSL